LYDALLGTSPIVAGFCLSDSEPPIWKLYIEGRCTYKIKSPPPHSYTRFYDRKRPSLTRELVYNGRVANNVRIIYRELSNDIMRPAFQQDIQYDMDQSAEVAFREVIITVIEADNKEITYSVQEHFQDLE